MTAAAERDELRELGAPSERGRGMIRGVGESWLDGVPRAGGKRRTEAEIAGGDWPPAEKRASYLTPATVRGSMQHGYMYNGAYELNYPALRAGTDSYKTTEGKDRSLPPWGPAVDGIRVSYMEKAGKKFFAVRVQYAAHDVVLENPVAIDGMRHLGSRRFSAQPTLVDDKSAEAMLDDIIRDNPEKRDELALLINQVNQTRRDARTDAS